MSKPEKVNVAVVQMTCTANKEANVDKAIAKIAEAAKQGANIVCLQELFPGLYFCQTEDHIQFELAEPIPGPTSDRIQAAAKEHGVVVVASLFEKRAAGVYHNTAAVFDADGAFLGIYRKMHIPDDPHYYEKFYFTPGDVGFRTFDTKYGRVGVCICWDQWFPEAARLTALTGAQILVYPTAIGWLHPEKEEYGPSPSFGLGNDDAEPCDRQRCVRRRAEPGRYRGQHRVLGAFVRGRSDRYAVEGRLARSGRDLDRRCNLAQIDFSRTHWPFLRDRRIDAYSGLTKRFIDGDITS